jgi:rhamnosyltransferase
MKVSIVLRTYNEQRHLRELLTGIGEQIFDRGEIETVMVDSGSTDETLGIAREFPVRILSIPKDEFSFGRSLNIGCSAAVGDVLVFVSGHCIPTGPHWIDKLVAPLQDGGIVYSYGGQLGNESSHFSEKQIFLKYFPLHDKLPQEGFYCNNANAALLRKVWEDNPFDEDLTGLEDMHLAKRLVAQGLRIGYVSDASVYHLHNETWQQVRRRFEREAIALQYIMPEIHLRRRDVFRYFFSAVLLDMGAALQEGCLKRNLFDIINYRLRQFGGAYHGNNIHRQLSRKAKESYFYPR